MSNSFSIENSRPSKVKRLKFYRSDHGREQLKDNIKKFVETLPIITDFGSWLENIGDMRKRNT